MEKKIKSVPPQVELNKILLDRISELKIHGMFPGGVERKLQMNAYAAHFDRARHDRDIGHPHVYVYGASEEEFDETHKYLTHNKFFESRFFYRIEDLKLHPPYLIRPEVNVQQSTYREENLLEVIDRALADVIIVVDPDEYSPREWMKNIDFIAGYAKIKFIQKEGRLRKGVVGKHPHRNTTYEMELQRHPRHPILITERGIRKIQNNYTGMVKQHINKGYVDLIEYLVGHPHAIPGLSLDKVIDTIEDCNQGYKLRIHMDRCNDILAKFEGVSDKDTASFRSTTRKLLKKTGRWQTASGKHNREDFLKKKETDKHTIPEFIDEVPEYQDAPSDEQADSKYTPDLPADQYKTHALDNIADQEYR